MNTSDLLVSEAARPAARPTRTAGHWAVVPDLARVHGIRMLRHPVMLLGLAWYLLGMGFGAPDTPYEEYTAVTGLLVFVAGPLAFFAANLVAGSGRRSGADEWMPSLSLPSTHRTAALLLACLGPAAAAAVLDLVLLVVLDVGDVGMPVRWQHVASVPVAVLGAAVLGVTVARLLPWPGVPMVVMVGLVTFNLWVASFAEHLGFYVDYAVWTDTDAIPAMRPGSASWHLVYLVALCGLAASGAFLRDARRRWAPVACGAGFGVVVLVAGWLQLP